MKINEAINRLIDKANKVLKKPHVIMANDLSVDQIEKIKEILPEKQVVGWWAAVNDEDGIVTLSTFAVLQTILTFEKILEKYESYESASAIVMAMSFFSEIDESIIMMREHSAHCKECEGMRKEEKKHVH